VREVFAEEEPGAAVGKDEGHALHVGAVSGIKKAGNLLKEGGHEGKRKMKN